MCCDCSEQDLCFHEKQLELQPTAVSTACLYCMQEPVGKLSSYMYYPYVHVYITTGIMLLEKQLLANGESASGGRSAKRARTTSAAALDLTTTTWVEMSRYMYMECVHIYIHIHTRSLNSQVIYVTIISLVQQPCCNGLDINGRLLMAFLIRLFNDKDMLQFMFHRIHIHVHVRI